MNDSGIAKDIEVLVAKYDAMKKRDKMDLSSDQDLTIAIMNLIGIEEHLFFTGAKIGKSEYFDLISAVRDVRKNLLQKVVKNSTGEVWCISKHLLAASYRLMEVGTKQLELGNQQDAYDFFTKAYNLYSLFWGLQMKLIPINDMKKNDENSLSKYDEKSSRFMKKLGSLVQKVVSCCIE